MHCLILSVSTLLAGAPFLYAAARRAIGRMFSRSLVRSCLQELVGSCVRMHSSSPSCLSLPLSLCLFVCLSIYLSVCLSLPPSPDRLPPSLSTAGRVLRRLDSIFLRCVNLIKSFYHLLFLSRRWAEHHSTFRPGYGMQGVHGNCSLVLIQRQLLKSNVFSGLGCSMMGWDEMR